MKSSGNPLLPLELIVIKGKGYEMSSLPV
jgi:hypothetical protein